MGLVPGVIKKHKLLLSIVLLVLELGSAIAEGKRSLCPCGLVDGQLSCTNENTIFDFPQDVLKPPPGCPRHNTSGVLGMVIQNQHIRRLNQDAFVNFPNLLYLSITYSRIEKIAKNTFRGIRKLETLSLSNNNLNLIEQGALDNLVNLKYLNVRHNPNLYVYSTNAWHFCINAGKYNLGEDDLTLKKNLVRSSFTEDYCRFQDPSKEKCNILNGIIDCTSIEKFKNFPCLTNQVNFSHILFNLTKDSFPKIVEDFHAGESKAFVQDFNAHKGSMSYSKYMMDLKLYGTKYDLRQLIYLTSEMTESVTIKADTVYLSGPITINYRLHIQARTVSIGFPITMNMTKSQFFNKDGLESWALKEELYSVGQVTMCRLVYGFITILQKCTEETMGYKPDVCQPDFFKVEETGIDISDWFDVTAINLQYVGARTILKEGLNQNLVNKISKFILGFVYNSTIVKEQSTFQAAQKFIHLLELNTEENMHNIPSFSVDTISQLADVMHDNMDLYKINENNQEIKLTLATNRVEDMINDFKQIQLQQGKYLDSELTILNSIANTAKTNWVFNFEHRSGIEVEISKSLEKLQQQTYSMQNQELNIVLRQARESQKHSSIVIKKAIDHQKRLNNMLSQSAKVQEDLKDKFKKHTTVLRKLMPAFRNDINVWKYKAKRKAIMNIAESILSFGESLIPFGKKIIKKKKKNRRRKRGIVQDIGAIIGSIEELKETEMIIQDVQKIASTLNFDQISGINYPISTNFKNALRSATALKLRKSEFDNLKSKAEITVNEVSVLTNNQISSVNDIKMALIGACGVGNQIVNEATFFAEKLLDYYKHKDEIEVEEKSKERTITEIEQIESELRNVEKAKTHFVDTRNIAKNTYETQLDKLKREYLSVTKSQEQILKDRVLDSFYKFQESMESLKVDYFHHLSLLQSSIHQKFYSLKEHSMNQRAMILDLFLDYCDVEFYHSFRTCDTENIPSMSDDFENILRKLKGLQWNTLTSKDTIGNIPLEFKQEFMINPATETTPNEMKSLIVHTFKEMGQVYINLKDLDKGKSLSSRFSRIRIETVKLILLDEYDKLILNNSTQSMFGNEVQIMIQYPQKFYDIDQLQREHSFWSKEFTCTSDYVVLGTDWNKDLNWRSQCRVASDYKDRNYQPSLDGFYHFQIMNPESVDMTKIRKLLIIVSGSRIVP